MQIVIDIDEDVYRARQCWAANPKRMVDEVDIAIANGTPLPKGHGRLIDLNDLYDFDRRKVEYAPTIIKAERGE